MLVSSTQFIDQCDDIFTVFIDINTGIDRLNHTFCIDDKGHSARKWSALHQHAVLGGNAAIGVAQQGILELLTLRKGCLARDIIKTDAKDLHLELIE